ncbi:MAG TPA: ATPase, T2SS/T4P/T4SS family [Anaerolineales bacterium]|nr:ATPase, T2SS/T4P/T4SS family [Anaerolineales bacterium]
MPIAVDESVHSLDDDRVRKIFGQLHQCLGISVDFNSCEPYGLQFWTKLEAELVKALGIRSIEDIEAGRKKLSGFLKRVIKEQQIQLSRSEFRKLLDQLVDLYFGLGVLDSWLRDDSKFGILINGFQEIYFESRGKLHRASVSFWSDAHLRHVINRLCIRNNIDLPSDKNPVKTFSLPDNSSVMVLFPPATPNSPCLSIRSRVAKKPLTIDQLIQFGSMSTDILQFLKHSVEAQLNILVCGHSGSGANTLVNILSSFISGDERVISIEYESEYSLRINHLIRLIANNDPLSEHTYGKLLALAGNMRGDRIILGEFLSSDAYHALNSINDDFAGSIVRVVAKSPADAVNRLERFIQLDKPALPVTKTRELIRSSLDLIVYQERLPDGSRVVKEIVEVLDKMDSNEHVALKELFGVEQTGVQDGRILRKFVSRGRPSEKMMNKFESAGIEFSSTMFAAGADVERARELTEIDKRAIKLSKGNYVFISYSTKNLDRVLALAKELEKRDFYVWLDKWYLEPGEDWSKGLEKAIKNAGAFIVILTPDSVDAPAVRGEIISAQDERLPIIPVKMGACDVPIQIKTLQYILYDEHDVAATINRLSNALSKYISNKRLFGYI